jgi:hypothetical protein
MAPTCVETNFPVEFPAGIRMTERLGQVLAGNGEYCYFTSPPSKPRVRCCCTVMKRARTMAVVMREAAIR